MLLGSAGVTVRPVFLKKFLILLFVELSTKAGLATLAGWGAGSG
jgi:hypothetical protein